MFRPHTDQQTLVLAYLRRQRTEGRKSVTTADVGVLKRHSTSWSGIGYDAALSILKGLERRGDVVRVRPPSIWDRPPRRLAEVVVWSVVASAVGRVLAAWVGRRRR